MRWFAIVCERIIIQISFGWFPGDFVGSGFEATRIGSVDGEVGGF
jgi:hypothetical protein